jgi:tetratricopeptide (TPR) repeat protein
LHKAVALDPKSAEARTNLGIALAEARRLDEAIAAYQSAIALQPDHTEARNNLGTALMALGRHGEAAVQFEHALARKPDLAAFHNNLGSALAALGRHADAVPSYRKALQLDPRFVQAGNNLGLSLVALGNAEQAIEVYRSVLALMPADADAHANLAAALAALNRHEAAVPHFEAALAARPDSVETRNNLANSLAALKRYQEAVPHYLKAVELRPGLADAHNNLGAVLAALERPAEALQHYSQAIAIRPDFADAHNNLGNALAALDRNEQALASYRSALALDPAMAEAHAGAGVMLETLGQLEAARREFEAAVSLAPRRGAFHRSLAGIKRFAAGDPQLAAMEALEQDQALGADQRVHLHFAMAKAYDDLGDPARAFRHLVSGNAGKRANVEYDEAAALHTIVQTAAVFTAAEMRRHAGQGDPSPVPIFIIGMPRSGSTLIEQILASHSRVFGGGELPDFSAAVADIAGAGGNPSAPFPEFGADMTATQFRRLGARYVERVRSKAPTAERITDKTLGNFLCAGLIHLALPNARIIHARRDPVDTCLSCFSKLFATGMAFTYDLAELGRYHRAYDALMAHWRDVLPTGVMLEVTYEDLVADFEPQARRIVEHCGLAWEAQCLSFHTTQRPVKTASAAQVRQPLYRGAVGRAQQYGALLSPLLEALNGVES